jgi:hypothetical protein
MGTRFQILVFMCDVFEKYNVHLGVYVLIWSCI